MPSSPRYILNEPDVIFERFEEEVVAIQLGTGAYHRVSGAGQDAFPLFASKPTAEEIVEALAEYYEESPERIVAGVNAWIEHLREESLIVELPPEPRNGPRPRLPQTESRPPYAPPGLQAFRDLQDLFLMDPVHDVGPLGWPEAKPADAPAQPFRYRTRGQEAMLFERFDDETVAINLSSGVYHSLAGPAEDVFLLLSEAPTLAELASALTAKYQATEAEVSTGVLPFLDSLVQAGLIERSALEDVAETRALPLAKPGTGIRFSAPSLDTFRDHDPAPALLSGNEGRSNVDHFRKRFRIPKSGVLVTFAGPEAAMVNLASGDYYRVNPSASTVLRLLQQEPTATELLDALGKVYDASRASLTATVLLLLHNLRREGLVEVEEAGDETHELDVSACGGSREFAPFVVEARRDLRDLFLLFPAASAKSDDSAGDGQYLAAMLAKYFADAAKRAGETSAAFELGGQVVRVRCAGSLDATKVCAAFEHLPHDIPDATRAALTIHSWDYVSGGAPPQGFLRMFLDKLFANWPQECGPRGEVAAFHTRELPVLYHAGPDVLSVIDVASGAAYVLKRDDSPLPYWESGSPFRGVMHFWLSTRGIQVVHGGAVGHATGGVILAGKGGVGKSTTSLACLNAGMLYASDDYCAVDSQSVPNLYSLYSTAKLRGPEDLDRFPNLRSHVWNPECFSNDRGDKATFFLHRVWPERVVAGFPLRAVVVPQITGERDTRLGECSHGDALLALAASTVAQLPTAGAVDMERLAAIVERVPRHTLYLGTDLDQIPRVIQSVL